MRNISWEKRKVVKFIQKKKMYPFKKTTEATAMLI